MFWISLYFRKEFSLSEEIYAKRIMTVNRLGMHRFWDLKKLNDVLR